MMDQLRQTCRRLLEEGRVQVIIGYGRPAALPGADSGSAAGAPAIPVFIQKPEDTSLLVWDQTCLANLTTYLTRKEVRVLGRPAVVVKGCDARALVVLAQESQVVRDEVYAIGMVCAGVGEPPAGKCRACDVRLPRHVDEVIGDPGPPPAETPRLTVADRYPELAEFMQRPREERMAYWAGELARCVKCYACRQVCPLCYCERCIVDKNRPTRLSTSATLMGNFAWAITRAFHQAGRCIGCDECTRACPAGIDLRLLNLSLARAAEESFGYRAGLDPSIPPPIGAYALQDKETFIR